MQFRIQIDGSHTEGPEARTRFEKIVRTFLDQLGSNGFIADYANATTDMSKPPVSLLVAKGGDPEPASWQAEVLTEQQRAPAKAEAATVATANQPSISKAAERITDIRLQPETSDTVTDTVAKDSTLSVEFASKAAADLAAENNLTDAHFTDVEPSSEKGHTVADVNEAITAKEDAAGVPA